MGKLSTASLNVMAPGITIGSLAGMSQNFNLANLQGLQNLQNVQVRNMSHQQLYHQILKENAPPGFLFCYLTFLMAYAHILNVHCMSWCVYLLC